MQEDRFVKAKRAAGGAAADAGWSPGVGPILGIALCALLLLGAIILGVTTGLGVLFAVPLGLLAIVVALVLLRGGRRAASGLCPHCRARIDFPSHLSEFNCPACGGRVETR
ncbi:MAG TPA: hypothetical protein VD968_05190 [Pyrinomonadaceae bacterium]|nr:hypothetical protein [Pyrinomonadaceae bacterium]